MVVAGHELYFYTRYDEEKHRNDMEIDFILSNHSKLKYKIFPIEMKSNDKYTIRSLIRFNESFHQRIEESYVIHPKSLSVKDVSTHCMALASSFSPRYLCPELKILFLWTKKNLILRSSPLISLPEVPVKSLYDIIQKFG